MPKIFIDNKALEAKADETIMQAAYRNGIQIPHFCWHPELSISGNCRMCLVEVGMPQKNADGSLAKDNNGNLIINYMAKLQIACATQVVEGMHVATVSPKAIQAQEAVMEFLLINHPLDCPICDEAGQCKLQDYAYNHSTGISRFIEEKNHKPKRQLWSDFIVYDAERCISCSRCIRFAKEIAKQNVLTFVNRNDSVTIELEKDKKFDNNYSMNIIDICPVGALTSNDFRFKSRVWDMSFNDSICPGCSRGCNIKIGVRNNQILRIEPRTNMYVNKYWSCDYGRLNQYVYVNENRLISPLIRQNGILEKSNWNDSIKLAADKLKSFKPNEIMFLGSARASNEDNYLLFKFAKQVIKSPNIDYIDFVDESFADDFLKTAQLSANTTGVKIIRGELNPNTTTILSLSEKIQKKEIKALYIIDNSISSYPKLNAVIDKLDILIIHSYSNKEEMFNNASIVFPSATYAETEGTITNINKRVQHFVPALITTENIRFMGMKMSRLDKFGAHNDKWTQTNKIDCRPNWLIIKLIANILNIKWNYNRANEIFIEISENLKEFNGMSYPKLDEFQGLNVFQAKNPDVKLNNYESHTLKPN